MTDTFVVKTEGGQIYLIFFTQWSLNEIQLTQKGI